MHGVLEPVEGQDLLMDEHSQQIMQGKSEVQYLEEELTIARRHLRDLSYKRVILLQSINGITMKSSNVCYYAQATSRERGDAVTVALLPIVHSNGLPIIFVGGATYRPVDAPQNKMEARNGALLRALHHRKHDNNFEIIPNNKIGPGTLDETRQGYFTELLERAMSHARIQIENDEGSRNSLTSSRIRPFTLVRQAIN